MRRPPFLTATWRNLIVINFEVSPERLLPLLPTGTELDLYEGKALASIVAFHFTDTKLFGFIPALTARSFEEVNLRFYVRRKKGEETRRGVVFVKEVVPSRIIAAVARTIYEEPYERRAMWNDQRRFDTVDGGDLTYGLQMGRHSIEISASTEGPLRKLTPGSVQEFILEHYWGYTRRKNGMTSEYRVFHPPWRYWDTSSIMIAGDIGSLYPPELRDIFNHPPSSSFVAQGSPVSVFTFRRVPKTR